MSDRSEFLRSDAEQTLAALTGADRQQCRKFLTLLLEIVDEERSEREMYQNMLANSTDE